MTESMLQLLRCPYCGGQFTLHEAARRSAGGEIQTGVVWCECCAFPVVAGIPVLKSDAASGAAMRAIEAGRDEDALVSLLGLEAERGEAFRAMVLRNGVTTYREAIEILSPDPEGTYFVYRFSDPTYVLAETVMSALAQEPAVFRGPVLDLCGGSGHLTRVLTGLRPADRVVLADMFFWKLWLAKTITAPASVPVCCDANQPLPFAAGSFPTVVLSDAFPYIWQKRLLAGEMVRQAGPGGLIVMPHLHSSLGWNYSAGMTLTPRSYSALFAELQPRLFPDDALFGPAADRTGLDLSRPMSAEELGSENSFTLIATRDSRAFRAYAPQAMAPAAGALIVNPLYRISREGTDSVLTLTFPTAQYEEEFAATRRYLPDVLTLDVDASAPVTEWPASVDVETLRRRRVLIDAPPRYC
ncbi:MAG TPA: methyltransferase domain-containing protein [Vicinamibacterales bacterium]|nr:methyltransferase domain-containing protein [Vicinamibacterales bacterium]